MSKNLIKGELILFLTAALWGSCFVFMKASMDYVGPFTLSTFRFLLGALVMLPFMMIFKNQANGQSSGREEPQMDKKTEQKLLLKGGLACGIASFAAASLQQIGLVYTTSGKASFITELEIVVVAIICAVTARKIRKSTVFGVVIAVTGMYLLCVSEGLSLNIGDYFELLCAIGWGIQIMLVDKFAKLCNIFKLAVFQFVVAGALSAVFMIFEKPQIGAILQCTAPILYTGVIEVALCYTLQMIGQRYVPPVLSSVTMALQSVFAAVLGFVFLNEILTVKEILGCVLMFLAILTVQLPMLRKPSIKYTS